MRHLPLVAIAALALPAAAPADDLRWANPAGGSFHEAANWDPPRVPTAGDTAVFDLPNTYTVTLAAEVNEVALHVLTGEPTIDLAEHDWLRGSIAFPGHKGTPSILTLARGGFYMYGSPSIIGDLLDRPTFRLLEGARVGDDPSRGNGMLLRGLNMELRDSQISVGGVVALEEVAAILRGDHASIWSSGQGTGNTGIGLSQNTTVVLEDGASLDSEGIGIGEGCVLDIGAASRASAFGIHGDGRLVVRDGGVAHASDVGSHIGVADLFVTGTGSVAESYGGTGHVTVENGGLVVGADFGWRAQTLTVRGSGATARLIGWYQPGGPIEVLDGGHLSTGWVNCPVVARGEGTTVGSGNVLRIDDCSSCSSGDTNGSLVLEDGATIDTDELIVNGPLIFRQGEHSTGAIELDYRGVMVVEQDATLAAESLLFYHGGFLRVDGLLDVPFGFVSGLGRISGHGTIRTDIDLKDGSVWPGAMYPDHSVGTLTFEGDVLGNGFGALIEIDLAPDGRSDRVVAENIHLGGPLSLYPLPGYAPALGDRFEIMRAQSITGHVHRYSHIPTAPPGLAYRILYEPTAVEIAVVCRGDWNADSAADAEDFTAFRAAYLASDWQADLNNDNGLTVADFLAFRDAYLAGCP